jgi:hypothetical protein
MEKSEGFPPQLAQRANFTREAYFTCAQAHISRALAHFTWVCRADKPKFENI